MTPANYISLAALAVSLVMAVFSIINITKTQERATESEKEKEEKRVKEEAMQQTSITLALDHIKNSLTRIENEITTIKEDTRANHDKIIIMEQYYKSEHKRLDERERRLQRLEEEYRERHLANDN